MPKSKKTRAKKYHPRIVKVGPYWPAEAQADVEAKLTQVALYVESSLPAGTLTDQQMDWIEDTLNWFLGLLYKRYEHLNQQEIDEVGPIAMAARKAINDRRRLSTSFRKRQRGSLYCSPFFCVKKALDV